MQEKSVKSVKSVGIFVQNSRKWFKKKDLSLRETLPVTGNR